jgi:hypothetical protein
VAYNPIADLERQGVPCQKFDQEILSVLGRLSRSEVDAFAAIWHKAASGGMNTPTPAPGGGAQMVGWIFGRVGY